MIGKGAVIGAPLEDSKLTVIGPGIKVPDGTVIGPGKIITSADDLPDPAKKQEGGN